MDTVLLDSLNVARVFSLFFVCVSMCASPVQIVVVAVIVVVHIIKFR